MAKFKAKIESERKKIDAKLEKLKEQKKNLVQKIKDETRQKKLAQKIGLIILHNFGKSPFSYEEFQAAINSKLTSNLDRTALGLPDLPQNAQAKKRGPKPKKTSQ